MFGGHCCQSNKIFGTKDNHFSTLGDVTKMNVFSHLYEEGAEILSAEISDA